MYSLASVGANCVCNKTKWYFWKKNKILITLYTVNLKIVSINTNHAFEENKWQGIEVLKYASIFKVLCTKKQRRHEFYGEAA